jgi:hypothetical protein
LDVVKIDQLFLTQMWLKLYDQHDYICSYEMTKMIKAISWYGIINFIFKLKIKLFLWIYNDIMKL